MPKKIWDMIQKYFLALNKAQTYGSDTPPMCKNKMSEKLKQQRQRKGKKMTVSMKLKTVIQLNEDREN